jgi:hypothetical protein
MKDRVWFESQIYEGIREAVEGEEEWFESWSGETQE